jgi:hypothetical protein
MAFPVVIAQAAAEYGALSAVAAAFASARLRLEAAVGADNVPFVVVGAVLLVAFVLSRWRH